MACVFSSGGPRVRSEGWSPSGGRLECHLRRRAPEVDIVALMILCAWRSCDGGQTKVAGATLAAFDTLETWTRIMLLEGAPLAIEIKSARNQGAPSGRLEVASKEGSKGCGHEPLRPAPGPGHKATGHISSRWVRPRARQDTN